MSENNKTYTIEIDTNKPPTDKYIVVNLTQSYEFINILSLKLSLSSLKSYKAFSADYGVITGRVIANGGVGLPNCKICLFTPKSTDDQLERQGRKLSHLDKVKMKIGELFYPFKSSKDLDTNGKQFNLLPKYSRFQPQSGFPDNYDGIGFKPKTAVGDFPEKEEVLMDDKINYVYNKYFKYATVTNDSGDFMMVVPTGSYDLVMNCDITDIGRFSVSPKFIFDTKPVNLDDFEEDGTKIKEGIAPQNAPNIIMQSIPVNIKSLWSNSKEEDTGINYQNINVSQNITPTALITGSNFGMNKNAWYMDYAIARIYFGFRNFCLDAGTINLYDNKQKANCGGDVPCDGGIKLDFYISFFDPFQFSICLKIIFPKILPFLKVETSLFEPGGVYKCRVNGGKFDNPPFFFKYVKDIPCTCDKIDEKIILDSIKNPDDLTASLDLSNQESNPTKIKILTFSPNIDNTTAELLNIGDTNALDSVDIVNDIKVLSRSQYAEINNNGIYSIELPMNYRKMVTNSFGELVDSLDDTGVYTENRCYMLFESDSEVDSPQNKAKNATLKIKVPTLNQTSTKNGIDYTNNNHWICRHTKFELGNIYTTAMYMNSINMFNTVSAISKTDIPFFPTPQLQLTEDYSWDFDAIRLVDLPVNNLIVNNNIKLNDSISTNTFENEWLNGSLYFMNIGYKIKKKIAKDVACTYLVSSNNETNTANIRDNKNPLGGNLINNKLYINSLNFPTEFVKLNKYDYVDLFNLSEKSGVAVDNYNLNESNLYETNSEKTYFYKGLNSDFIKNNLYSNLI